MFSLSELGITSIGLEIEDLAKVDQSVASSQVLGRTRVLTERGENLSAYDVALFFGAEVSSAPNPSPLAFMQKQVTPDLSVAHII